MTDQGGLDSGLAPLPGRRTAPRFRPPQLCVLRSLHPHEIPFPVSTPLKRDYIASNIETSYRCPVFLHGSALGPDNVYSSGLQNRPSDLWGAHKLVRGVDLVDLTSSILVPLS